MNRASLVCVPQSLWDLAGMAEWRVLVVDFDAVMTLDSSPVWIRRAISLLSRIARQGRTTIAVASSGPIAELDTWLGGLRATFIGEHGWERREPGEPLVQFRPREDVLHVLDQAAGDAAAIGWRSGLRRTRTAVVVSAGDVPGGRAGVLDPCRKAWEVRASQPRMRLCQTSNGLELRAARRNMGTALLSLMSRPVVGPLVVYVGDDLRDEEAFETIRDCGYGIRLSATERPSVASGWIRSGEEFEAFLQAWLDLCEELPRRTDGADRLRPGTVH